MESEVLATWNNLQADLRDFVYRKVKDKGLAADIVQDVFLKVHANLPQLKDKKKFASWIYRITQNLVMDHFRKHKSAIDPADVDWESSYHKFNECVAYCLNVLLDGLPAKYRDALRLTELENLTQYELAQRLNISHSGARSRVQRARKLLKERIEALYVIKTDFYGNITTCENRVSCCCKKEC